VLELLIWEVIEDVGGRFGAAVEVAYSQGLVGADRLGVPLTHFSGITDRISA
jgi:hypothetical protein